ncbi:hypothetical protein LPJ61_004957 [Coemansia biformis]|uniref:Adhesin domain-containing protein n=1 Tax=Coemansia biformis TaxID=1286918 RepID=A0A9W7Y8A7_9FUNG|nr:hypothetical protein LPJ61_004957 [Coemansia biformis]
MSLGACIRNGGLLDCEPPPVLAAEALPPYTLVDPGSDAAGDGDALSGDTGAAVAAPMLPTDMAVTAGAGPTSAAQLLLPVGSVAVALEGFASVTATVRVDDSGASGGLLSVAAVFHREGQHSRGPAVIASSQADEKAGRQTIRFAPAPEHAGEAVHAECSIAVPAAAALNELVLRLPAGSRLDIAQIDRAMVRRLDVAMVAGTVQLSQVGAGHLRVAVADGTISARDVDAGEAAEFVVCSGAIRVCGCTAKAIRANAPGARLAMSDLRAEALSIRGCQADIAVRTVAAKTVTVSTSRGAVALDGIAAESLDVRTDTAPVRGSWNISRSLAIAASSAMVQGRLSLASEQVQTAISTSSWPVQLAVDSSFRGCFDVRASGSIAKVDLAGTTVHERHPHWTQGVAGTGSSSLRITNANSPVVVTAF